MATGEQNKLNAIKGIARLVSCTAEERTNLANETIPKNVVVKVDNEDDVYIGDGTSSLQILPPFKPSTAGNADTADSFKEDQTIEIRGDIAGTASSKAGWTIDVTLNSTGVTAGTYGIDRDTIGNDSTTIDIPQITVDEKGRVTLITTHTFTAVNSVPDLKTMTAEEATIGILTESRLITPEILNNKIQEMIDAIPEATSDEINELFHQTTSDDSTNTSDTTDTTSTDTSSDTSSENSSETTD